jgi:putative membrane protein insertion efficiency factor
MLIRFYQNAISPHIPASCRYYPTCSAYAYEAVRKYGVFRGLHLAFRRILRCHPFHPGGFDPVP